MTTQFKKTIYIILAAILGFVLNFIVHGAIEIPVLYLFQKDFEKYGLGLDWQIWVLIHHVGSVTLVITGIIFGIWLGFRWYVILYDNKGNLRKQYEFKNIFNRCKYSKKN